MRKLRVDRLDLMQVHNLVDAQTHLATLREWKAAGRIRYLGVTHYHAGAHADLEQLIRKGDIDFVQVNYSLAEPEAERRLLGVAAEAGTAVIVNRPFAEGAMFRRVRDRALPEWAKDAGAASWAQFFLKWILAHPAVTCVDPGHAQSPARGRQSGRAVRAAARRGDAPADGRALQLAVGGNPGDVMPRNEAGRYRHIEVQPVAGALGAEIRGVNVAAALDDAVIAEIRQAFLDHLVIFFRDQKLTPHEQLAFARRFGEPMEYPQLKGCRSAR